MITTLDLTGLRAHLDEEDLLGVIRDNLLPIEQILRGVFYAPQDWGWAYPARLETDPLVDRILAIAEKIRREADVFVLVGVGGSNRGAQSVIEALGDGKVEIIYAGDSLSSQALKRILAIIAGRAVFINVIAKDFTTLEPGIAFRFLRRHFDGLDAQGASDRIIVTGSKDEGQLFDLSRRHNYEYLPFPEDMGGRFSVISAVGLLPMAVAGIDIRSLIRGAAAAQRELGSLAPEMHPACRYAAARSLLYEGGFRIEQLTLLEPSMAYFGRWWSQLFAESEGKNQRCLFPTTAGYSEDLHAVGQFIQDGKRMVIETFLDARFYDAQLVIRRDSVIDGFDFLNGRPYDELNAAAYRAACSAHVDSGVPCIQFHCGPITAEMFGELFYLFMQSCCISAALIGVHPFGQPGVEAYKANMARILREPEKDEGK